jgi:hypothetical protein
MPNRGRLQNALRRGLSTPLSMEPTSTASLNATQTSQGASLAGGAAGAPGTGAAGADDYLAQMSKEYWKLVSRTASGSNVTASSMRFCCPVCRLSAMQIQLDRAGMPLPRILIMGVMYQVDLM